MNKPGFFAEQRGFSLLEVLMAMFILITIVLPILSVLASSNRQSNSIDNIQQAKHLAQSKLEEVKAMEWTEFKTTFLDHDSFLKSLPEDDFTYQIKIWPSQNHLLYTVQVTVFYQEAGQKKWQTLYTEKMRR